jgi:hypothetical protein
MLDAGALDPRCKLTADLLGELGRDLVAEEGGHNHHRPQLQRSSSVGFTASRKVACLKFRRKHASNRWLKPKGQSAIDVETGRRRDLADEQHLGIPRTAVAPLSVDPSGRSSPAGWPRMTHPINSVVIGSASPATVSAKRVRIKSKQQNRSPSRAVTVTSHKIACFRNFSEIGVNQKRPFATAHSLWECKLHQIIVGVQHH